MESDENQASVPAPEDESELKEMSLPQFAAILFGPIVVIAAIAVVWQLVAGDRGASLAFLNLVGIVAVAGFALYLGIAGLGNLLGGMSRQLSGTQRGERFARGLLQLLSCLALISLVFFWLIWSLFRF